MSKPKVDDALIHLNKKLLILSQRDFKTPCQKNPKRFERPTTDETAARLCGDCPVLLECRAYGEADPGAMGVWGGISIDEPYTSKVRKTGKKEDK